jgi:hypothetical protein
MNIGGEEPRIRPVHEQGQGPVTGPKAAGDSKSSEKTTNAASKALEGIKNIGLRMERVHYTAKAKVIRAFGGVGRYDATIPLIKSEIFAHKANPVSMKFLEKAITAKIAEQKASRAGFQLNKSADLVEACNRTIKILEQNRSEVRVHLKRANLVSDLEKAKADLVEANKNPAGKKINYLKSVESLAEKKLQIFDEEQKIFRNTITDSTIGDSLNELKKLRFVYHTLNVSMPNREKDDLEPNSFVILPRGVGRNAMKQSLKDQLKFCERLLKENEGNNEWIKANKELVKLHIQELNKEIDT